MSGWFVVDLFVTLSLIALVVAHLDKRDMRRREDRFRESMRRWDQ